MSDKLRRIVVAVKHPGATPSIALAKAAQLARELHAELILFHAIELPLLAEAYWGDERRLGDDQNSIRRDFIRGLEQQAASLRAQGIQVSVDSEWDFPASKAILRYAQASGADLVVVGQSEQATAHRTVRQLVELSPMPVLLARTPGPYAAPALLAAVNPRRRWHQAAALGAQICRQAQQLSAALSGSWHLVQARPAGLHLRSSTLSVLDRFPPSGLKTAGSVTAAVLPRSGVPPRSIRRLSGRPEHAILQAARMVRAQILVLGSPLGLGVYAHLPGSTLWRLLEHASYDILIIKPARFPTHFSMQPRGAHIVSGVAAPSGLGHPLAVV